MRATIGIIIVFGILYAAGQWMWKEPKKQHPHEDSKVYTLPEKYSLLKNKFGEFVVSIDTVHLLGVVEAGRYVYVDTLVRDTGFIAKEDISTVWPNAIVFNVKDAQIFSDSSIAIKVAYRMDSVQNSERIKQQQKQIDKHIQDSINNLRYSTFKQAK